MLSNKDFVTIVKEGDTSSASKVRYDLKQVAQWDRQIKAEIDKKSTVKKKTRTKEKDEEGLNSELPGYRDRALERRNEERKQPSAEQSEELPKLDVEQTKFLGGDLEHTHLVKGLDYALLAKVRSDVGKELKKLQAIDSIGIEHKELKDIPTSTHLGFNLKKLFLSNKLRGVFAQSHDAIEFMEQQGSVGKVPAINKLKQTYVSDWPQSSSNGNASIKGRRTPSKTEETINRTIYEFDCNPRSSQDVPLTILRSKQESIFTEIYAHFAIDAKLLCQIQSLYDESTGKLIPKSQRKPSTVGLPTPHGEQKPAKLTTISEHHVTPIVKSIDSIYDDELVVGKYSSLEQIPSNNKRNRRYPLNTIVVFNNDDVASSSSNNVQQVEERSKFGLTKQEMSEKTNQRQEQPVAVSKKVIKSEKTVTLPPQRAPISIPTHATNSSSNSDRGRLINRDVFATTLGKVITVDDELGKKQGDSFGARGDYDLFPETGDYEVSAY